MFLGINSPSLVGGGILGIPSTLHTNSNSHSVWTCTPGAPLTTFTKSGYYLLKLCPPRTILPVQRRIDDPANKPRAFSNRHRGYHDNIVPELRIAIHDLPRYVTRRIFALRPNLRLLVRREGGEEEHAAIPFCPRVSRLEHYHFNNVYR